MPRRRPGFAQLSSVDAAVAGSYQRQSRFHAHATADDQLGRPYINGNREQANQYFLDGQQNSEDKNNEVGYTPGVDAIQEFNIITQNASAEFGNTRAGGQRHD